MMKKLKPNLDLARMMKEQVKQACACYMQVASEGSPSIRETARRLAVSPAKARKLLITGGVYTSAKAEHIQKLSKTGLSVGEIASKMHMTSACVSSYLPYIKIVYGLDEKSVDADRMDRYRARKTALQALKQAVEKQRDDVNAWYEALWSCILVYQNMIFSTAPRGGEGIENFSYFVSPSEAAAGDADGIILLTSRGNLSVARESVTSAFARAAEGAFIPDGNSALTARKSAVNYYLRTLFLYWGLTGAT